MPNGKFHLYQLDESISNLRVHPIVCVGSVLVFVLLCNTSIPSSLANILTRKRELVALLFFFFLCLITVNVM